MYPSWVHMHTHTGVRIHESDSECFSVIKQIFAAQCTLYI